MMMNFSRQLQKLVDDREIRGLVKKADWFLSANFFESDKGYNDPIGDYMFAFKDGMRFAKKAIKSGKKIFYVTVNEAAGESTLFFLANSVAEACNRVRPIKLNWISKK